MPDQCAGCDHSSQALCPCDCGCRYSQPVDRALAGAADAYTGCKERCRCEE